ncbi:MAG TPA: redoxin domain-containing protein [Candidatus Saccharimonadales bacterium]
MASHKELNTGDHAPSFSLPDSFGNIIALADYADTYVLAVFLRYASCPFCNLTIHRLSLEEKLLSQNGCKVIVFVQSGSENIQNNIHDRHGAPPLPFPIIPDPEQKYYAKYGVRTSLLAAAKSIKDIPYWLKSAFQLGFNQKAVDGNLLLVPAMFLIGPGEQRITYASYGPSFYDHRSFTEVYEQLIFK